MAHGHNIIPGKHHVPQRLCLNPCLYTGIALAVLCFAAVKPDIISVLDDGLIAAASERHIDGAPGRLIIVRIILAIDANADTDGHGCIAAHIDCFHTVQD